MTIASKIISPAPRPAGTPERDALWSEAQCFAGTVGAALRYFVTGEVPEGTDERLEARRIEILQAGQLARERQQGKFGPPVGVGLVSENPAITMRKLTRWMEGIARSEPADLFGRDRSRILHDSLSLLDLRWTFRNSMTEDFTSAAATALSSLLGVQCFVPERQADIFVVAHRIEHNLLFSIGNPHAQITTAAIADHYQHGGASTIELLLQTGDRVRAAARRAIEQVSPRTPVPWDESTTTQAVKILSSLIISFQTDIAEGDINLDRSLNAFFVVAWHLTQSPVLDKIRPNHTRELAGLFRALVDPLHNRMDLIQWGEPTHGSVMKYFSCLILVHRLAKEIEFTVPSHFRDLLAALYREKVTAVSHESNPAAPASLSRFFVELRDALCERGIHVTWE